MAESSNEHRTERHGSETSLGEHVSSLADKLQKLGMKEVSWLGKCEADRVTIGHYDVAAGEDGMYGLVFDNTQSKQFSKTVTFVLMTYPTNAPPASGSNSHMALAQALSGKHNRRVSPSKRGSYYPMMSESSEHEDNEGRQTNQRPSSNAGSEAAASRGSSFYTGVLSKRRRKQHQGYAKRFFSLDFTSSTLSYYKNRHSSALRGSVPLSLAAIGANEKTRQISVDSGAEVWLLRAGNQQEFEGWRDALERATQPTEASPVTESAPGPPSGRAARSSVAEDEEWLTLEALVGRVSGITASVRRIAKDTDPKYMPSNTGIDSGASSPLEPSHEDYFDNESSKSFRPSFWRRKSSRNQASTPSFGRNVSGDRLAPPTPDPLNPPKTRSQSPLRSRQDAPAEVHDRCMAVLRDLDAAVANFSNLIAQSRERRMPARPEPISRTSTDSLGSQEFFDAEEGRSSRFLTISRDTEGDGFSDRGDAASINSASTVSVNETPADTDQSSPNQLFPDRPKTLSPLPRAHIARRSTIPPAKSQPPSLFAFLRKNVGKDLSTIAMPVTINEPLSLLQKSAEPLEYAHLLDTAATTATDTADSSTRRLVLISAFAIAGLASNRARERAVRKPFNPMLGETFELVREDLGFRFLAEKVAHRPVRVACQAEGGSSGSSPCTWTYTHAPSPSQKFWGKSAELVTDGLCRVRLHGMGERYSWAPAQAFLRNIVAGDKYVEPVGSMTITEETSGRRAVVTFKAGGMFSGRSEEVTVVCYAVDGSTLSPGLTGKWTTELTMSTGETVWRASPLLQQAATRFGFTPFAATLNEVTAMEDNALPPTDSRLRPDQRAYEEGHVDRAEDLKVKLEEAQRRRRKDMETNGEEWRARWFECVSEKQGEEGEEVWRMKGSDEPSANYWDVREAVVDLKGGRWDGVRDIFEI